MQAGVLLALAYPDRIAQQRSPGSFRMSNGRGAILPLEDPLSSAPLLAIGELGGTSGNARIRQAAPLERELLEKLYPSKITVEKSVYWDAGEEAVLACSRRCFGALILNEKALESPDDTDVVRAMLEGIRTLGLQSLPWTDSQLALRQRVAFMRALEGDIWPDLSDEALMNDLQWIEPFLSGISRRSQLVRLPLDAALALLLPRSLRNRLNQEAPESLSVPSGSAIRLDYSGTVHESTVKGPILAVKLQEVFGMTQTPRVANGRIPVLLHLLSPAGRPLQITQDIEGFWKNGYPSVRAEMRGRYPKHPWPDNPLAALPTRHTKKQLERQSDRN